MSSKILASALIKVPELGFKAALLDAARAHGYSDAAISLFPRAEYDLVAHHLDVQRNNLLSIDLSDSKTPSDKLQKLLASRLNGNNQLGTRLPEYLSILSQHPGASLQALHSLSDDLWYLAGDNASDFSWYTRRASLSSIYAAAELYQSQNPSGVGRFVKDRLAELNSVDSMAKNSREWINFNVIAGFNVLKSLTR